MLVKGKYKFQKIYYSIYKMNFFNLKELKFYPFYFLPINHYHD